MNSVLIAIITSITAAVFIFIFQKSFSNIIAGIILKISKPFRVGDKIAVRQSINEIASGHVRKVGIVSTQVTTYTRDVIIIPNILLLESCTVINSDTKSGTNYIQRFAVSFDTNVPYVKEVIYNALMESEYTVNTQENTEIICRIENNRLVISYNVRSEDSGKSFIACSDVTERMAKAFIGREDIKPM